MKAQPNKSMVFLGMGFELVVLILGAAYFGEKIDKHFGWPGYASVILILLFLASWFFIFWLFLKKLAAKTVGLKALWIHMIVVLGVSSIVWGILGQETAITLCIGGLVSGITLASVIWSTSRIFTQKPIALTAFSIVIKYALIGAILLYVTQYTQLSALWLGLGVGLLLPTLMISSFLWNRSEEIGS